MKLIPRLKASGCTIKGQSTSLGNSLTSYSVSIELKQQSLHSLPARLGNNGLPDRVVIDKSGVNPAALENMNCLLILNGWFRLIEAPQVKHLDNIYWAASPFHQEVDTMDAGVRILLLSLGNTGRYLSRIYDPQATIWNTRPMPIQAVCGSRWINLSKNHY